jgi:hypothetical protein
VTAAHLDYDTLADLAEGLLPEVRVASAGAHLADCAECRDRSAEIANVTRLLADAPLPPMPDALASRIDEALAAEAAATGHDVMSLDSRRGRRRIRVLSAAAAAVVVVGGGALVGNALLNGPVSSESGTAQSQPIQDRSGSAAANQPGPGANSLKGSRGDAGTAGGYLTLRSGTDYTAARLGEQVSVQLTKGGDRRSAEELAPTRLTNCVRTVTQGKIPLLVDVATYEGRAATVIVLPGADSARLDVWIVGPACSASDPAVIKHTQATR